MVFRLLTVSLIPVIASLLIFFIEKKTSFDKLPFIHKQIFIGIFFGLLGLSLTYFGVQTGDYKTNVRDAAPMCAGLLFGAPAGIIAGIIAGTERIIASFGGHTANLVGGISTIIIGLYTAVFRIFIFEDKKPTTFFSIIFALVGETIHFILVFFFFSTDVYTTFKIIETSAPLMISLTAFSVIASVFIIQVISKQLNARKNRRNQLLILFQRGLIICVLGAFAVKILFNFSVQNQFCTSETSRLLESTLDDVSLDIMDYSNRNLLQVTEKIAEEINSNSYDLNDLVKKYSVEDISIIDKNGIITDSTVMDFISYDMYSDDQSREFCVILEGRDNYVQKYQPLSIDKSIGRKFAGKNINNGGFVQVGYSFEQFKNSIDLIVKYIAINRHAGNNGYTFICDENFNLIGTSKNFSPEMYNAELTKETLKVTDPLKIYPINVNGQKFFSMYTNCEGYKIFASVDEKSATFARNISFYITLLMDSIVFLALFIFIFIMVKIGVVNNINKITQFLGKIVNGNLNQLLTFTARKNSVHFQMTSIQQ